MSQLELSNLRVSRGNETILDIPELTIEKGSQVLLTGASGSGKSTLIHFLAGFIRARAGCYRFEGQEVADLGERQWDSLRASRIGVVFQHYPMLRGFDVLNNILIPMGLAGKVEPERAIELLKQVGLEKRIYHRPSQLSAGQRQRVSIVRSLINEPGLVLADEPTAHLDPDSGKAAVALLKEMASEAGATLLLVSHDPALVSEFEIHLELAKINLVQAAVS